jgi:Ca2+:H+ antiporter
MLSAAAGPPVHDFEIAAIALSIAIVNLIASDGESNWMEGVLLLAVYTILGLAFYTMPA